MARKMKIIWPAPQGRAYDTSGKIRYTGEVGMFSEETIARRAKWFEPVKESKPKPKPKAKVKKTVEKSSEE